jgi:hypothetical protein
MFSYFQYIHSLNVKILNSRPASGRVTPEGLYMKRHSFFKLLGLFALIVAIGFSMTACPHETPDPGNTDPVVPSINLFEGTWKGYNDSTTKEYTLTFVSDGTWTISPDLGMGNGDTGTYIYDDKVATLLSADSTEIGTLTIGADGKLSGDLQGVSGSSLDNAGKLGGGILGGLGKL